MSHIDRKPCEHESKPGKHGTLRRYRVRYDDGVPSVTGWPGSSFLAWRYSSEHAIDAFHESNDTDFRLVSVENYRCLDCAH